MNKTAAGQPRVVSTATANPPYCIDADTTKRYLHHVFGGTYRDLQRAERMVDHSGIETRYMAVPVEDLVQASRLEARNTTYIRTAKDLTCEVAERALRRAAVAPSAVDLVIVVSCTGYAIPSLDVYLVGRLGLRPGVRRLPIAELGCGAGVAALALAANYVRAHPGSTALIVSVELCSLTFQPADNSWQNVVAGVLFGDGAVAVVVTDRPQGAGPAILADRTHLIPDTLDYMCFSLKDSGFHLTMSPEVPEVVRTVYPPVLDSFLSDHELTRRDLGFYVLHPGGAKILRYFERYLQVPVCWLEPAHEEMRRHGNMSSASVLFVLDEVMAHHRPESGVLGMMGGLGPGFSVEMLLLRWESEPSGKEGARAT